MKKLFFALLIAVFMSGCGSTYNSALKQIDLGMTKQEVVTLMGDKYSTTQSEHVGNKDYETIEYKDMYKFHWFFQFADGKLVKWWKEKE